MPLNIETKPIYIYMIGSNRYFDHPDFIVTANTIYSHD